MERRHISLGPKELVSAGQEDGSKDSQGTERPQKTLFNGLMDEVVVGVVGLQWVQVSALGWAFQEVGVPEKVGAVSHQGRNHRRLRRSNTNQGRSLIKIHETLQWV